MIFSRFAHKTSSNCSIQLFDSFRKKPRMKPLSKSNALLQACRYNSLSGVRAALEAGENVYATDDKGLSILMRVLMFMEKCAPRENDRNIVAELIAAGGSMLVNYATKEGVFAIHAATSYAPFSMVEMLLEAGSVVDPVSNDSDTPLICACRRSWRDNNENIVPIVELLIKRRANLETCDRYGDTPLNNAAQCSTIELVETLIRCGANVNAINSNGNTAISVALLNDDDDKGDIITALVRAGADVNVMNNNHQTPLLRAMNYGGKKIRKIASLYSSQDRPLAHKVPGCMNADPIGTVREGTVLGCNIDNGDFRRALDNKNEYPLHIYRKWALLRLASENIAGKPHYVEYIHHFVQTCQDPSFWYWCGLELLTTRNSQNGETLLHVAARTNNVIGVCELIRIHTNPLLRNHIGQQAIDLTSDNSIRIKLLDYISQSDRLPSLTVLRWYGPYCMARIRTFLLVTRRWANTRICVLPKDVVRLIAQHIRFSEYT